MVHCWNHLCLSNQTDNVSILDKATFGSSDPRERELTIFLVLLIQVKVNHLKRGTGDNGFIILSIL